MFNGQAEQDKFVVNILNGKQNLWYIYISEKLEETDIYKYEPKGNDHNELREVEKVYDINIPNYFTLEEGQTDADLLYFPLIYKTNLYIITQNLMPKISNQKIQEKDNKTLEKYHITIQLSDNNIKEQLFTNYENGISEKSSENLEEKIQVISAHISKGNSVKYLWHIKYGTLFHYAYIKIPK